MTADLETVACPKCGRLVSRGGFYCPGCGMKLRSAVPSDTASIGSFAASASVPASEDHQAMAAIHRAPAFQELDRRLSKQLGLNRLTGITAMPPTLLCESGEEFYGAMFKDEPLSATQMKALLQSQLEEARRSAKRGGGVWGVFLATRGCLLNGWLFQQFYGESSARSCLKNPEAFRHMLAVAAHEKWGHGFLSTCSALGREAQGLHLQRFRYAHHFPQQTVTTPEGLVLREKWSAVFGATRFAEEGWASWVEKFSSGAQAGKAPEGRFDALELPAEARKALDQLLSPAVPVPGAARAMQYFEEAEDDMAQTFVRQFGQTPRYVVGHALCATIARRFGPACAPASAVLAANVTYSIASTSVSDLANVVAADDSMNVNRRLAAIAHLPCKDNPALQPADLAKACHELLGFAIPEGMKQ